jgi:hypothetical protein
MPKRRHLWSILGAALVLCAAGLLGWRLFTRFPAQYDRATTAIELTRTGCLGTCPAYTVRLFGDGTVAFEGEYNVFAPGTHVANIAPTDVDRLVARFRAADFFALHGHYRRNVTDQPTYTLRLTIGGRSKAVEDYDGIEDGMPASVRALEDQTDRVAGTARWVKGTPETLPALLDESWNFAADTPQNRNLFRAALWAHKDAIVARFAVQRLNPVKEDDGEPPLLCVASAAGEVNLVRRMIEALGPGMLSSTLSDACLASAAGSGNLPMLRLWLGYGAHASQKTMLNESDALPNAIQSGNPAMVAAVLKLAPPTDFKVDSDPIVDWLFNWWRYRGRSVPLSKLHEIVQLLLANGVHVDARNNIQATALIMNGHVEDVIRELLDDGADPTLRDEHGDTALADAREMNCEPCIDLLETAVRQREASGRNVRK